MSEGDEAGEAGSAASEVPGVARRLLDLRVHNFRSLRNVTLPLGPLNALVGPNGAGKSNVIEALRFLADIARDDLYPAIDARGGFDQIVYRGVARDDPYMEIGFRAVWTKHSTPAAPDTFTIRLERTSGGVARAERYAFAQPDGQLTITLARDMMVVEGPGRGVEKFASASASALADNGLFPDLARVKPIRAFRQYVKGTGIFDIDAAAARSAVPYQGAPARLTNSAENLAVVMANLAGSDSSTWSCLVEDARVVMPQLQDIEFHYPSVPNQRQGRYVEVVLREYGLARSTPLADASFGTIRLLSLLALLYNPDPPVLTCIEEVDHGLHPQALEMLVNRLREASERTQLIVTTHSPTLANRLRPEELIVCERNQDGSSAIPAISTERIKEIVAASEGLPLGDLWFSGTLGGAL